MIRRICVFCGSNKGTDPLYVDAARTLGRLLAREGVGLVYGGGSVGLMGEVADAVLGAGGEVIGVIPHALWAREVGHRGLTDLRIVDTMHERKAMMADLATRSSRSRAAWGRSRRSSRCGRGRSSACTKSRSASSTSTASTRR